MEKKQEIEPQNLNMNDIHSIQRWLAYCIFNNEKDFLAYKTIEKYVPAKMFWSFKWLIEFTEWKIFQDLEVGKVSTDICSLWLTNEYVDMITSGFVVSNFFRDVKTLLKIHFWDKMTADNFKKYAYIIDQINSAENSSKNNEYLVDNLYEKMLEDLIQKSESMKATGAFGYSYWLQLVDKITKGIQKKKVTRLSAYSNTGKSKFTYQLFNKLLDQNAKILYFSLEVDNVEILEQIFQSRFGLTNIELIAQKGFDTINFDELFGKWEQLYIVDDMYDIDSIVNYTNFVKPDVVFIDFVQNITVNWATTEYQAMTKVALELQKMAKKNNIALFDLSQVSNEQAKGSGGITFKAKGSGALVASADVLLTLSPGSIDWMLELEVSKNKFWPNRQKIDIAVDFDRVSFKEIWFSETNDNSKKDIPL